MVYPLGSANDVVDDGFELSRVRLEYPVFLKVFYIPVSAIIVGRFFALEFEYVEA